jgi:hypothetical protein
MNFSRCRRYPFVGRKGAAASGDDDVMMKVAVAVTEMAQFEKDAARKSPENCKGTGGDTIEMGNLRWWWTWLRGFGYLYSSA